MITEDELRALAPEEWQEVWGLVLAEHDRRLLLESAPVDAARLADAYLTARDGEQPPAGTSTAQPGAWPAWVQPQGAHDAYPAEHLVAYEGRVWRSLIDANVWAPGTQGAGPLWEDVTADPEPTEPDNPATGGTPTRTWIRRSRMSLPRRRRPRGRRACPTSPVTRSSIRA